MVFTLLIADEVMTYRCDPSTRTWHFQADYISIASEFENSNIEYVNLTTYLQVILMKI